MKKPFLLFLLLCVTILTGCLVRSLHPLYTKKDIIFDDKIIGIWSDEENAKWQFTKDSDGYKLVDFDKRGNKAQFDIHLLALGKYKFIDLYLTDLDENFGEKFNGFGLLHLVPVHTFMRVDSIDKEIKLRFFNLEWLEKTVKENPNSITHIKTGKNDDATVILTADTPELQKFVLKNAEGEAFSQELVLKQMNGLLSE